MCCEASISIRKVQTSMNSVSGGELWRSVVVTNARYVVLLFFVVRGPKS